MLGGLGYFLKIYRFVVYVSSQPPVYLVSGLFAVLQKISKQTKMLCRGHCHYKILLLFLHIVNLHAKVY